jgi:hypothetical protein
MTTLSLRRRGGGLGLSPHRRRAKGAAVPGIVTDGLVAEWRFDQGAGQVLTDYKGGFHGQLGSTAGADAADPTWTAEGLSFDGGDYVKIPALPAIRGVDIVFRPNGAISRMTPVQFLLASIRDSGVFSLGSATGLLTDEIVCHQAQAADGYSGNWRVGWTSAAGSISVGWHLLQSDVRAATEYWNIVLDGVEKDNAVAGTPQAAFIPGVWAIGSRAGASAGSNAFSGRIAYAIFYATARTTAQQAQNRAALASILAARGIALP